MFHPIHKFSVCPSSSGCGRRNIFTFIFQAHGASRCLGFARTCCLVGQLIVCIKLLSGKHQQKRATFYDISSCPLPYHRNKHINLARLTNYAFLANSIEGPSNLSILKFPVDLTTRYRDERTSSGGATGAVLGVSRECYAWSGNGSGGGVGRGSSSGRSGMQRTALGGATGSTQQRGR